jgi:hypothetical protein
MRKPLFFLLLTCAALQQSYGWWDPGHMATAMIAYLNLNPKAKARVDSLTAVLQRDYPQVNHFIATGPWPDDIKADGVRAYDSWHYTNLPYNPDNIALPDDPEVDVVWAIGECEDVLRSNKAHAIEKARFLAFLVHFVSDLHQPLHSTSYYSQTQPGGNQGGNQFLLKGTWRNLHALWDDGCGYLSPYNDIRPYNQPKAPLSEAQIGRIRDLAKELMRDYPEKKFPEAEILDADFWALESHKLAIRYGYRGVSGKNEQGRTLYLMPGEEPTPYYLEQGQEIVRKQIALSGYRLARLLNETLGAP